jgi:hypothetical protein
MKEKDKCAKAFKTLVKNQAKLYRKITNVDDSFYKNTFELNTLNLGMIRQSGTTTNIINMFNHESDIYIGFNYGCIQSFISKYKELHNIEIHQPVRYLNFANCSDDMRGVRGMSFQGNMNVYFDIGQTSMSHEKQLKLRQMQINIMQFFYKNKPFFIIS